MKKFTSKPSPSQDAKATEKTPKTSRKIASYTHLRTGPVLSMLRDGLSTTYGGIMETRGALAVLLDKQHDAALSSMTTKLMELNHEMDSIHLKSETLFEAYLATRG